MRADATRARRVKELNLADMEETVARGRVVVAVEDNELSPIFPRFSDTNGPRASKMIEAGIEPTTACV